MPERPAPHGRASLAVIFVIVFLDLVGFGIVIPLLPLYADAFGAGPVTVTWLVAVYSLMQFFFSPGWGRLSDRVGRRPVLLMGLFGAALSYLLLGLSGSLAALFVARALNGVMGATIGVAQAYIADVTPPERRAGGMGLIGAAFGLGFIFGPAIGGMLAHYGAAAPFFGAALLAAANGILAVIRLPESLPPNARAQAGGSERPGLLARLRTLLSPRTGRRLRALYATSFLVTLAFAAVEAILSLWADRRWALSPSEVAYFFAFLGVVAVLAHGLMVRPLVRRFGEGGTARLGLVVLTAGLIAIPLAPSLPFLAAAGALLALGQGAVLPSVSALISRQGSAAEQGQILGASQSLSALARVLGPTWGGIAFAGVGLSAPYFSGAVLVLLALAVFVAGVGLSGEAG